MRRTLRRVRRLLRRALGSPGADDALFSPYKPMASSYMVRKPAGLANGELPKRIPPRGQWISEKYGDTPEQYLASGKKDLEDVKEILARSGTDISDIGNIMEFGCGDGRMIRWLEDLAHDREIWGCDIDSGRILWCKQHLSPPFHFLTTTIVPHLPFEDDYFGFIFAGSVFTHIDDLADAWFAELGRILRPGGKLFTTVHLKSDIPVVTEKYPDSWLAEVLKDHEQYARADFDAFTIGRSANSHVFYDMEFLQKGLAPRFRILSVTEEVRLYQAGLLLERV